MTEQNLFLHDAPMPSGRLSPASTSKGLMA